MRSEATQVIHEGQHTRPKITKRMPAKTNGAARANGHAASTKPTNIRSWQVHARLVKEAMQEQEKAHEEKVKAHEEKVKARLKTGQRFEDAKRELDHGDYGKMLKACGKDEDYARGHRKIAGHHILGDSAHARKMPSNVEKIIKRLKPARPLEVFVPAFAAWPAALRRPAPPATLAQRPALN
jgi:hypothetical protein